MPTQQLQLKLYYCSQHQKRDGCIPPITDIGYSKNIDGTIVPSKQGSGGVTPRSFRFNGTFWKNIKGLLAR